MNGRHPGGLSQRFLGRLRLHAPHPFTAQLVLRPIHPDLIVDDERRRCGDTS